MKKFIHILFLVTSILPVFGYADETNLSPAEIKLCRKNGCFDQGVSKNVYVTRIGAEQINIDKNTRNKYLEIEVEATVKTEEGDIEITYSILQWIGDDKFLDKEKMNDARAFTKSLEDLRKYGKSANFVVRGSANMVTADFPLLGYFTTDGDFFFLKRIVAEALDKL